MPFCTQCGVQVSATDQFCNVCGAKQQVAAKPAASRIDSMSPRTMSVLCYVPVVGWIAAIIALASQRFRDDRDVRFHAFQGLYLFVAWLILDWGVSPFFSFFPHGFFSVNKILRFLLFGSSIFMLVKTSQGEKFSLPVFGELAERSLAEQTLR